MSTILPRAGADTQPKKGGSGSATLTGAALFWSVGARAALFWLELKPLFFGPNWSCTFLLEMEQLFFGRNCLFWSELEPAFFGRNWSHPFLVRTEAALFWWKPLFFGGRHPEGTAPAPAQAKVVLIKFINLFLFIFYNHWNQCLQSPLAVMWILIGFLQIQIQPFFSVRIRIQYRSRLKYMLKKCCL